MTDETRAHGAPLEMRNHVTGVMRTVYLQYSRESWGYLAKGRYGLMTIRDVMSMFTTRGPQVGPLAALLAAGLLHEPDMDEDSILDWFEMRDVRRLSETVGAAMVFSLYPADVESDI